MGQGELGPQHRFRIRDRLLRIRPQVLGSTEDHAVPGGRRSSNASISPRFTSHDFYNCSGPWFALSSRLQLKEGDILAYSNGASGHVVIYAGGDVWNSPIVYEAPGTGQTLRRAALYLSERATCLAGVALFWKRTTIVIDNPTAKSVGGNDDGGNWTRSTSIAGYYGDDYQTQAGTSATAWARWTPRFAGFGLLQRLHPLDERLQPRLVQPRSPSRPPSGLFANASTSGMGGTGTCSAATTSRPATPGNRQRDHTRHRCERLRGRRRCEVRAHRVGDRRRHAVR